MKSASRAQAHRLSRWAEAAARLLGCCLAWLLALGLSLDGLAAPAAAAPPIAAAAPIAAGAVPHPADEAEMGLYQQFAAVNLCLARADGLSMEQAVPLAAGTLALILGERHGGRIEALQGEPLAAEQLLSGSANYVLLAAAGLCPDRIPAPLLETLRQGLKDAAQSERNPAVEGGRTVSAEAGRNDSAEGGQNVVAEVGLNDDNA